MFILIIHFLTVVSCALTNSRSVDFGVPFWFVLFDFLVYISFGGVFFQMFYACYGSISRNVH